MISKNLLVTMLFLGALRPMNTQAKVTEARACCDLSKVGIDLPLLSGAVEKVSPLYRNTRSGRHLRGVVITYRARAGESPDALQSALECLLAQGMAHPASGSPLAASDVTATVRTSGERVRAVITSDRESSAAKIVKRATKYLMNEAR